jgi:UDP-2,3-diacylglucosamine pyrophosphatase LpxH
MTSVATELTRALEGQFTLALPLDLQGSHKYIIFSDQHKGAGDKADEFKDSKETYIAALNHYLKENYSLILLGDVEELWEQGFKEVERAYQDVLMLEGSFPPGRYFRVWGNHDDRWMRERQVRNDLAKYMPTGAVYEAIRFELVDQRDDVGTMLLLHGHQGTLDSDKLQWLGRLVLPIYRQIQRLTGFGKTTPAKDACLSEEHDRVMYSWAAEQKKLILVTGHTHRPVWSSRTHLQKLQDELSQLKMQPESDEQRRLIECKEGEIRERELKYPPCGDSIKTFPAYMNSGCCKFQDGDITGIEIEDGEIRLIKWSSKTLERETLEREQLLTLYDEL